MSESPPTPRELEALKALWRGGPATVREVHEAMGAREEGLAYTTVLSLLQTMEKKGLVGHEPAGRAYAYFARVRRDAVLGLLAGRFLDDVFDGSLGECVALALRSRKPAPADLEAIERAVAEAREVARGRKGGAR
ncbi:BlaI/MecI/CopY family transcriptional regulator [Paludisphaera sp.]|uniref:BlaI/MecI/CopY family transcriptional regulator n=1 Tax=Paludisphaera sp. TaxID=2017432 RepID=UPI00301B8E04